MKAINTTLATTTRTFTQTLATFFIALCMAFVQQTQAETAAELVTRINGWNGGGTGSLSATASGNEVTVTGNVSDATTILTLNIDADVTVKWRATLGRTNPGGYIVSLNGGTGTFNMESGEISATTGDAIYNQTANTVNISDGTVSVTNGRAIYNTSTGTVNISGGTVSATTGSAVSNSSTGAVNISGGTVSATEGKAVSNSSTGTVNISGGTVSATTGSAVSSTGTGKITVSGASTKITSESASTGFGTIYLQANGTATDERLVIEGGLVEITAENNAAVYNRSTGAVSISGGTVSGTTGMAVRNIGDGKITVSGASTKITSANRNYGTISLGINGELVIEDGLVENTSGNGNAVYNDGTGAINISGGTVSATTGSAVYNRGAGAVSISGGTISATTGRAVYINSDGKITVSGASTKITSASTDALNSGTIYLTNIGTERLVIEGGLVENTANGNAVYNRGAGAVSISGGTVSAKDGYAIYNYGTGATTITDGAVFAYGTAATNVIYGTYDATSGNPAIIAWNKAAGNTEYTAFENDDIFALAPATAKWFNKDGKTGIAYANGDNTGFIEVPEVTVNKIASTGVTFPTASSITYNPSTTLSQIALTGGTGDGTFAWQSGTTVPTVTNSGYNVAFTPTDTENYDYTGITLIQSVALAVAKAIPAYTLPTGLTATADKTLADVTLPSGWAWESALTTAVGAVGTQTHKAKFTPTDTDNYNAITGIDLQVTVSEPTPIRLPQIAGSNIHAYAMGNNIILQNLPSGAKVEVFGLNGKLVYSNRENPSIGGIGVQTISVHTKGMYIVKTGTQIFRVAVR